MVRAMYGYLDNPNFRNRVKVELKSMGWDATLASDQDIGSYEDLSSRVFGNYTDNLSNNEIKALANNRGDSLLVVIRPDAGMDIRSRFFDVSESAKNKRKSIELIEITEDVRVPGTDVILEAGDKIKILKESSPGVPYDVSVDYFVVNGRKVSVVHNKSGAFSAHMVIDEGTSYEISDLYNFGAGHVSFLIEAYDYEMQPPAMVYSWITYDSKKDALKDGWRL